MLINNSKVKNIIAFLLALGLILPIFGWIHSPQVVFAQNQPANLNDILDKTWQAFPEGPKKIWNEEILPMWHQINIWLNEKKPKNRGGVELKKEKKKLEEELSKIKNSLRERFKQIKNFKIPDILK